MGEITKQIIISKVKLVKDGIRINYEKYRDSYWDTLQLTYEEPYRCRASEVHGHADMGSRAASAG